MKAPPASTGYDAAQAHAAVYAALAQERAAWKRARRAELLAVLREAGDAVQGGVGDCGCGCAGAGGCGEASVTAVQRGRNPDRRAASAIPGVTQPIPEILRGDCDGSEPPYLQMPDFQDIHPLTQTCFFEQFGKMDWPEIGCCPPSLRQTTDCSPPSILEYMAMLLAVPRYDKMPPSRSDFMRYAPPTAHDQQLFGAALAVLKQNMDIALWATCLVESWSPELVGLDLAGFVRYMLTQRENGRFPFSITYVLWGDDGATMTAIKPEFKTAEEIELVGEYGIVLMIAPTAEPAAVPSDSVHKRRMNQWLQGGTDALCASVALASEILHEIIHIGADDYDSHIKDNHAEIFGSPFTVDDDDIDFIGAKHDKINSGNNTCWDEARMIATIFVYGMSQRYTCLSNATCCQRMNDEGFFAYSEPTQSQIMNRC